MASDDDDDWWVPESDQFDSDCDSNYRAYDPDKAAAEEMVKKFAGGGTPGASLRLAQEIQTMATSPDSHGFRAEPVGDNLYVWSVVLDGFEGPLDSDLEAWAARSGKPKGVHLRMIFPADYPMAPPFVRVLYPRFQFMTGHVTSGGSVCMQLLTRTGWVPANTVESVLVQIRAEIASDPKVRLDPSSDKPYDEEEARRAFDRMCAKYGWS